MNTPVHHTTACASCGGTFLQEWCRAKDTNRRMSGREFVVARCSACGIVQTLPQPTPEELQTFYPEVYYADPANVDALRVFQREKLGILQQFRTDGRLLDVGAGIGLFVREAVDAGFDAEGIEISGHAVRTGSARLNVRLTAGDLLDIPIPADSFDVVTLWHVLEHLPNPASVLQAIHRILRTNGLLLIAVPNIGSIQARVFRSRWYHLDVPRHLFHYSPETLAGILQRSGFSVLATRYRSREHNPAGILGSVLRLSLPAETMVHKAVRKLLGMPAARALAALESSVSRGGTFVMAARPSGKG